MRSALLASLAGHAVVVAAFATLDWRGPEDLPAIPIAVLTPPALAEQMPEPASSTASSEAPPPPTGPMAAANAPGIDVAGALVDPLGALARDSAPPPPMPPNRKPSRQVAKANPAPVVPASAAPVADGASANEIGAIAPAAGPVMASTEPAGAPIVEHGPAPLAGNPLPDYPSAARRRAIQGRAVVRATVTVDGRVASVELVRSTSHDMLDRAALEALRRWRFTPARRGDQAIAGAVDVPVVFRLED